MHPHVCGGGPSRNRASVLWLSLIGAGLATWNHQLCCEHLNDLAALIAGLASQNHDPPIRLGARRPNLHDLADDMKLVTGTSGLRPSDLTPAPMIPPAIGAPPFTSSHIVRAAVCQPLAARPANSDFAAASSLR